MVVNVSWVFLAYVTAYALASIGCVVALRRAVAIADDETRRGLVGLLVGSGGWAVLQLGFLVVPSRAAAYATYMASLVVGLTTVGAWLYFCSAYTGRSFHRNRTYRRVAVGAYLGIVAVKLTNPLHGFYFTTAFVSDPFPHVTIQHEPFHWVVTGLSYALVAVGFFMLYEAFLEADYDTRPLGAVVAVTGLPVVFDLLGFATPMLIDINHEPLGVAVFAVAALYAFDDRFLAVQLTDGIDDPVVYLDDDNRIRQFNARAEALFPDLSGSVGEPIGTALPAVDRCFGDGRSVIDVERSGGTRHYLVSETAFSLGQTDIGRLVVFTDVTETEHRRRELERHNDQLEGLGAAVRHELRNTLNVVDGHVGRAGRALDRGDVESARTALRTASGTTDRIAVLVEDFATLAAHGRTLESTEPVDLERAAGEAAEAAGCVGLALDVRCAATADADPARLRRLLECAFEFAEWNEADEVRVELRPDGFEVVDDGDPIGGTNPDAYFEYGVAVPDAELGLTLPNLETFARSHGWETTIEPVSDGGARIVVSGATVRRREPTVAGDA